MEAVQDQASFSESTGPLAESGGIVDFAPIHLRSDAHVHEAVRLFVESGVWGIPIVNGADQYVGTCTLRSVIASTLPAARGIGSGKHAGQNAAERDRRERALRRPVAETLDLEVPAVRLSTALPRLLDVLCRRAPVVPIISDSGGRLVGVASLDRALRALYAG